jgi:hypothetical protein
MRGSAYESSRQVKPVSCAYCSSSSKPRRLRHALHISHDAINY